ncbi:ABC transporter permease [Alkalitalea saponilacus]|uniref:FtsX-like permease family protein n=1 Tax=Alkalitalea saponilacus TaxID=889453 RepID=A0A1T5CXM9_9BACT|nr:ABC transporter permease [Alkalitalea saponilacus]ASB50521.1 peptide ABC transporter permease [Alkalitalea saponilacus]SKB64214.1 FtsX-like permease family protein [Alkalitalea saponilacus]
MNTITYIFRKLQKDKVPNYLGIAGLATGLICVLYIFFWVTNEINYDRFHENTDEIFVVHAIMEGGDEPINFHGAPPAVATALQNEHPQVTNTARMMPAFAEWMLSYNGEKQMRYTAFADYSIFDIFSFEFIYGSPGEPTVRNQIVITESTAINLFGDKNPVGEIINFNNMENLVVAGVIKDIPHNSSIQFQALIPLEMITTIFENESFLNTWYNNAFMTFGLLNDAKSFPVIEEAVKNRIQQVYPDSTNFLRAYKFKNTWLYEMNNIRNIRIFSFIGLLILLTAILNFINLNTARSARQVKENGIRKSLGAVKSNLIKIVYSEISVVCLIAFSMALVVTIIGLPKFNQFINKEIELTSLLHWAPLSILTLLLFITILLSGLYPAIVLSGYSPVQSLRSSFQSIKNRGILRNSLIITIFVMSIALLGSTFVINNQISHLQKLDLGFTKDQIVYVRLNGQLQSQASTLQNELSRNPNILSTAVLSNLPNAIGNNGEGWNWENRNIEFRPLVFNWYTSHDLLETLEVELNEGTFFRENQQNAVVINRTFARMIGWDNFQGRSITNWDNSYEIAGVVEDFHFNNIGTATEPIAIFPAARDWDANFLAIKIASQNISETLSYIRDKAINIEPAFPIQPTFLEHEYRVMLEPENNLKKLISIFTLFAIIVLTLGLTGLIMFMAEQKTKEIGIRKSLGEETHSIILRLLKPFIIAGLISSIIAIPLSWYAMSRWLENYAQRITPGIDTFLFASAITILLAIITVSIQSWNAARKNPIHALRNE